MSLQFSFGLLLALFVFAGLGALFLWRIKNQLTQQLRDQNQTLLLLNREKASLEVQNSEAQKRIGGISLELDQLRKEHLIAVELRAKAESAARNLEQASEKERKLLEEAKQSLQDAFKSLASTALEGNTKQFLELAKSVLDKESSLAKSDLEKRHQSIRDLLTPISTTLDKYNFQLTEIEKQRQSSFQTIETEIRRVVESNATLTKETSALKDALKKPHVRGRWGEVQLRNCVELAGMSEFADVSFQDITTDEDGQKLIPDMTVRMPGGRVVVVDAKTPIDAFMSSLEATTEELRATEMARHGRHVKDHVKRLSTRAYNDSVKDAADFTVMFLPNESFLYAALESEPDLVEFALQKKVLIATPPTLIGLLKVIRFGWNEEKLAENAHRISEVGQELHKRLCDFLEAYTNIGKFLDKAKQEYEIGSMRLERRVLTQAKKLEDLGVKSVKELPESLGSLNASVALEESPEI